MSEYFIKKKSFPTCVCIFVCVSVWVGGSVYSPDQAAFDSSH